MAKISLSAKAPRAILSSLAGHLQSLVKHLVAANHAVVAHVDDIDRAFVTNDLLDVAEHVGKYIADGLGKMDAVKRVAADRSRPKSEIYAEYEKSIKKK